MRVLVLGGDGYLGWPTALHLSARGHDVVAVDSLIRRRWDTYCGTHSLVPIARMEPTAPLLEPAAPSLM